VNMELILMIFLVILGLISLSLIIYLAYLILRNFPKFLKTRKISMASYKEEILYYSENREVKKFCTVALFVVYIGALFKILSAYLLPDMGFGVYQEFGQYNFTLGLILVITAFSMIPAYFIIKIGLKEALLEKVPFPLVVGLPAIFPVFAFLSYDFTGNLFFSIILFFSGVLFNLLTFKYRNNDLEIVSSPPADLDAKKMIGGLSVYVAEFEPFRPPVSFGMTPYSFRNIFKLLFKQRQRFYFIKNSHLNLKTREKLDPYFQDMTKSGRESLLFFFLFVFMIFLVVLVSVLIFDIYLNLPLIYSMFLTLIGSMPLIYLVLAWKINKIRNYHGKKYENDIKSAIQLLIDYGNQFILEHELKPENFPIMLNHDDYSGLEYEQNGKNYFGFFKLNMVDLNEINLQQSIKTDEDELNDDKGYLVCEKCNGYYKLQAGESEEDFVECECGGKLKYHQDINELFDEVGEN